MVKKTRDSILLREGFFESKKIAKLRRTAGGNTYVIIYLKMLLASLENGGKLYFEGVEKDFASEIALDLDENVENVKTTINYLKQNGLLEEIDANTYALC